VQTITALERAHRDDEVAAQAITAAEERQRALEVEIQAAGSGLFLGDSYNDRPRSSQRADELQQQLVEFNALLSRNASQAKRLKMQLDDETARYAEQAETTIVAPSHASVWEVLTAPGEEVRRGQDLLRMLDCSTAIVTATVSESVFNRLRVGARARFHFRDAPPSWTAGRAVGRGLRRTLFAGDSAFPPVQGSLPRHGRHSRAHRYGFVQPGSYGAGHLRRRACR